ncbi:MAG: hypothetical protein FD138_301 [Planctomycetota bacterium]|nr:MAG: hypothetical protein FD138_301 [Planctomycetota bacterium]
MQPDCRVIDPNVYPALVTDITSTTDDKYAFRVLQYENGVFRVKDSTIVRLRDPKHAATFGVWRDALKYARTAQRVVAFYHDIHNSSWRVSELCLWRDKFDLSTANEHPAFNNLASLVGGVTNLELTADAICITIKGVKKCIPLPDPSFDEPEDTNYMQTFGIWITMAHIAKKYQRNLRIIETNKDANVVAVGLNWDDEEL